MKFINVSHHRLFNIIQIVEVNLFGAHVDQQFASIRTEGKVSNSLCSEAQLAIFDFIQMPWAIISDTLFAQIVFDLAVILAERYITHLKYNDKKIISLMLHVTYAV